MNIAKSLLDCGIEMATSGGDELPLLQLLSPDCCLSSLSFFGLETTSVKKMQRYYLVFKFNYSTKKAGSMQVQQ